jgi:hypothetical protein
MKGRIIRAAAFNQGGKFPTIACMNRATADLGVPFGKLTAALQKCYDDHFLPVWGYPVRLYNVPKGGKPKPDEWQFVYLDDADEAGALGYHDLTTTHQPLSKVFVKTTVAAGDLVSVTACHELFEMAIDPGAQLWAEGAGGVEYAYEMCDPVEEDTFEVDGVPMSNFVYPSWFEPWTHPKGAKYDHLGKLKKPFTMTKGGYMITKRNGRVDEVFGSAAKARRFAREDRMGHRSEHRKLGGQVIRPPRRLAA